MSPCQARAIIYYGGVSRDEPLFSAGLRLSGSRLAPIKKLLGFKSFHNVPKDVTNATREFVRACATPEIEQELEELWTTCRQEFDYKRVDKISVSVEKGLGVLVLKDFKFELSVEQDPEDPSAVIWRRVVDEIRDPGILLEAPFNRAFGQVFDCIEAPFAELQEMETIIDRIEALNAKSVTLEYPTDCSRCLVTLKTLGILVEITSEAYKIKFHGPAAPKSLYGKIFAFQQAITTTAPEKFLQFAQNQSDR